MLERKTCANPECKKEFVTGNPRQRYCNPKCNPHEKKPNYCLYCGKQIPNEVFKGYSWRWRKRIRPRFCDDYCMSMFKINGPKIEVRNND
jgi:hypothetical protein